jgi:hypothetical protein
MADEISWLRHWLTAQEVRVLTGLLAVLLLGAVVKHCRHRGEMTIEDHPGSQLPMLNKPIQVTPDDE